MEMVGPVAAALTTLTSRTAVTGDARLPMRGPAIVIANHTTIVDVAPVLATLHRAGLRPSRPCGQPECGHSHGHVQFLATERAFRNPLIGPLTRQAGFIPVAYRRHAPEALRAALATLRGGGIVGIYPEGDVSAAADGAPREFRAGAAWLALQLRCPVFPVAHRDARVIGHGSTARSLAGAATAIFRRPRLRVHIGHPIGPTEYAGLSCAAVNRLFRERVTAAWHQAGTHLAGAPSASQTVDRPLGLAGDQRSPLDQTSG